MTKNNEAIAEKPFQNSGVTRRLWRFQHAIVLERNIEVWFSLIPSSYKVVYINMKDFHAGYAATRWRNLLSNLPKMGILIGRNHTSDDDVQPYIVSEKCWHRCITLRILKVR